jgi:hypothetical protein
MLGGALELEEDTYLADFCCGGRSLVVVAGDCCSSVRLFGWSACGSLWLFLLFARSSSCTGGRVCAFVHLCTMARWWLGPDGVVQSERERAMNVDGD